MNDIILIIIAIAFSAFFSGIEIAFISANKLRIELLNKKGSISGTILSEFLKKPSHFIGTTLIGNNIALVIYGITIAKIMESPLISILPPDLQSKMYIILFQTIISTLIILVAGEFLPKVLFRISPNAILSTFALFFQFIYYLLYPLVIFFVWISESTLQLLMKVKIPENTLTFGKTDLEYFIKDTDNHTIEGEVKFDSKMFENALYLKEVKVRECLLPRTEIISIEVNDSIRKLKQLFKKTKLSKIIVYNGTIDNVLGYVHHFDMLHSIKSIRSAVIPIPLVPETMTASELLDVFIRKQKSIAWVVDEFGGTAGMVTLEDVIEEIFGEIEDEFDKDELVEKKIGDNTYIFSARVEADHLNEKYGLNIPEGDYETLAGYIIANHESIPKEMEKILIGKYEFTVLKCTENKFEIIKMNVIGIKDDQELQST